jgi:hypothetical protein
MDEASHSNVGFLPRFSRTPIAYKQNFNAICKQYKDDKICDWNFK